MADTDSEELARRLLGKLLKAGEKQAAGVSSRPPALTSSALTPYHSLRSLDEKESFEAVLKAARAIGAVVLTWPSADEKDFAQRIDLADAGKLAAFLGVETLSSRMMDASVVLSTWQARFPVIEKILTSWGRLANVRSLGPENAQNFADAARVIAHMEDFRDTRPIDQPIREVSARLFRDSKRIERLTVPLAILLAGDMKTERREPAEIWHEIGLFREEQPVRMAGDVVVVCSRVTSRLDAPYTALSADSIQCLTADPSLVLTIENLTTFHSEAKRRFQDDVLLIYTGGMPSPAWRAMYRRILQSVSNITQVAHWGDIDEGGFRIAAVLSQEAQCVGHILQPWRMHPDDVPEEQRTPATASTLARIRHHTSLAGWASLGDEIAQAGFVCEQEGLAIG